jgi:hypothetical protein
MGSIGLQRKKGSIGFADSAKPMGKKTHVHEFGNRVLLGGVERHHY